MKYVDKATFNKLGIKEQVKLFNSLLQEHNNIKEVCEDIGISYSTIRDRFSKHKYIFNKYSRAYELNHNKNIEKPVLWDELLLSRYHPNCPGLVAQIKKLPSHMGRELLAVPPNLPKANFLSLYRASPSNSSFAAPERNRYALLLSCINRQLSESLAGCFSFIALQYQYYGEL